MSEQRMRVLLVDDEESLREPLARRLHEDYGYLVDTAANSEEALHVIEEAQGRYDVALIDELLMPGPSGLEVMREVKARYPDIEVILFTGWGLDSALEALRAGAYRYLAKPFNLEELGMLIQAAAEHGQLRRERDLLAAMLEVGQAVSSTLERDSILQTIVNRMAKVIGVKQSGVVLFDQDREYGYVAAQYQEVPDDTVAQVRIPLRGNPSIDRILATKEPLAIYDAEDDPLTATIRDVVKVRSIKSILIAPLIVKGEVIGTIGLDATEERRHFTPEEMRLCQLMATQAAVAIENARLFDEANRRVANLETLQNLALTVNSSLDLSETLKRACQAAVEFFNADHSGLVLFDPDLVQGRVRAEYPAFGTLHTTIPLRGVPAEERLIETKEPLVLYNVADDESLGPVQDILLRFDIRSILIVPVTGKEGELLGSFSLDAVGRTRQFTQEEVELCKVFAAHVAVAVENARLFHEAKVAGERLRSSYEASSTLVSSQDPEQVLKDIVEQARLAANAAWVSVILIDEMGQARNLITAGTDKQFDVRKVIRPNGLSMHVMRTGVAVVIEDTSQQRERANPSMFRDNIAAALCLPLSLRGKRIGVMWVHYHEARHFPESELEALQLYVNQAAVAYDSARRMEELEHMRQAAEAMARALNLRQVLEQIVKSTKEVLQADSSAIWSYDNVRDQFIPEELVAYHIPRDELGRFRKNEPKQGGTADTVMELGWMGVTDISDPQYDFMGPSTLELLGSIGAKSFQGIALKVGDEKLGVLYVNYNRPRSFLAEDRQTLETFANHAALALKKARLLEQVGAARDAARVVAEVSTLGDLRHTLDSIVTGTREVLGCDAVTLYTYDQERDEFGFPPAMAGVKNEAEVLKLGRVAEQSVVRNILMLEKAYEAEDASSDPVMRGPFVSREGVKSSVGIPLRVGDRKVGVMFVNYRSRHRFTADELTNIGLFANQATVAIRNAQLYDETRKRAEALAGLYQAGQAITSTLSLEDTLDHITKQALHIIGARCEDQDCFSHIALREGDKLRFVAASSPEIYSHLDQYVDIDLNRGSQKIGIAGRTARIGQVQNVPNVNQDADYITVSERINSQLSVPFKVGEQVIGVISIEHPELKAFTPEDEHHVELLAAQAAVAIQNARQYDALRRQSQHQQAVYAASKVISAGITAEQKQLLDRILEQAVERIRPARGGKAVLGVIQLYDEAANELRFESVYPPGAFQALVDRLGERRSLDRSKGRIGINGRTVLEQKPQRVPDVRSDSDYVVLNETTRSELDVPLLEGDKVLGMLSLESDQVGAFDKQDERALQSLAELAVIAIQNARQYQELKHTKGLVGARTALAWMGMVSSAWRHAVDKHALTIREQNQLLRRDLQHSLSPQGYEAVSERLGTIERLTGQILEKPMIPPLAAEEGMALVAINDLLHERARQLWQNDPYRRAELKLDLRLDSAATVRVSPEWLRRALDILVDNAVEAVAGRKVRRITISTEPADGGARIAVADTGPGIPPEVQARLFERQVEKPEGARGFGIGLLIAQAIVQTYGGDIWVESTGPTGTAMVIWLPLAT